jgi:hypothetical protein
MRKPVFSTYKFFKGEKYPYEIKLDTREGIFYIQVPQELADVLFNGRREITNKTFDGIQQDFDKYIRDYDKLLTTRKKVIHFGFQANVFIWDEKHERCKIRLEDLHFSESPCIELWYQVGYVHELNDQKSFHDEKGKMLESNIDEETRNTLRGHATGGYIDWTEEREEFFKVHVQMIKNIIEAAYNFFSRTKEERIEFIDSRQGLLGKQNLLPAPKKKRK